jgi:hypothetical protein
MSWFAGWMAIAILANLIQVALGAMRSREISGCCQAPLNLAQAFRFNMIGTFFNQTLPSTIGGDAVRLWLATRTGASWRFATYSVFVDRLACRGASNSSATTTAARRWFWSMFGALLSNFSYVIYGLSQGGKNCSQAAIDFPPLTGAESHVSSFLYRKAFEAILSPPCLWPVSQKAFSRASSIYMLADASDGGSPWKPLHAAGPIALLIPATIYAALRLAFARPATFSHFHMFLLIQIAGFLMSRPFFDQEGGVRRPGNVSVPSGCGDPSRLQD